ncbi:MAG TPA: GldG family protein [Gammaproteobacteria bacterium]
MNINPKTRLAFRLQSTLTLLLTVVIVGALAWISDRYTIHFDWTAASRNTLSQASERLLDELEAPLEITAYARDNLVIRQAVRDLVSRYRSHKSDITLGFINPDKAPDEVRRLGITADGELVVRYAGRREQLKTINERDLTNAIYRVARGERRRVTYLGGHGERNLLGQANHDLGGFGRELEARGFSIIRLDLAKTEGIPDNTDVLVLSEGEIDAFPGELALIRDYLDRGGNLLWLGDPTRTTLRPLGAALGIRFHPGRVIEPLTRTFGVDDRAVVIVSEYGVHAATRNFRLLTILPGAVAVDVTPTTGWTVDPLLKTSARSWSDSGAGSGEPRLDPGEPTGPFTVAVALSRPRPDDSTERRATQRAIFVGDGDFLSNAYLGNAGNLELGLNLFNWLSADEGFIDIPARTAPDLDFNLSQSMSLVIAFVPLAVIPVLLLATGFFVWQRRRLK